MQLPHDIICIDIETTDSTSQHGSVIQIGATAVTKDFKLLDTFNIYIKPLDDYRNPKAMAVNKIPEITLATALPLNEALELFENFYGNPKGKILAAWGNYFDVPFLRAQYDKINRPWPFGYKSFDLKTIAIWEFAKRDLPLTGGLSKACELLNIEFTGTEHDGLDDIKNSVKVLQKLLSQSNSPTTGW